MKLSLSVRVAESFSDKRNSTMTIDELIAMAARYGYEALCMRASQARNALAGRASRRGPREDRRRRLEGLDGHGRLRGA